MWPANFEWALSRLKQWALMTREWWNWKNQYVWLQVPNPKSKMTHPYLYIKTVQGDVVPWSPSYTDLFSEDWATVDSDTEE